MRILVIGATGGTGTRVVQQGQQRGHIITAFARSVDPALMADSVIALRGDGRSPADVSAAVRGQDAVISAIGARSLGPTRISREVLANVMDAMGEHGVQRLVVTSSHALVARRPRFWAALARLIFRYPYADLRAMEQHVATSSLNVTIARANMLTDRPGSGLLTAPDGADFADGHYQLSRDAYAEALLDLAERPNDAIRAIELTGLRAPPRTASGPAQTTRPTGAAGDVAGESPRPL